MNRVARWIGIFLLCAAPLLLFGIIQHKKQQREDRAFAWVEKYVSYAKVLPSRNQKMWNYDAFHEGRNAINDVEEKLGISARSRATLGYLEFIGGSYQEAKKHFQEAAHLSPRDQLTIERIVEFNKYQKIEKVLMPLLQKRDEATGFAQISIQHQTIAVAIFLNKNASRKLVTFVTGSNQCQQIQFTASRYLPEFQQIFVRDLTGDGKPELIYIESQYDSGGGRDFVQVFTWRNNQFVAIYKQSDRLHSRFDDLDHDGKYEIESNTEIGDTMCHAAQPRWLDIYCFKNGRYILANNDFPQKFRDWPYKLLVSLKQYPQDGYLWRHLGKAYETQKHLKAALRAYKKAENIFTKSKDRDAIKLIHRSVLNIEKQI